MRIKKNHKFILFVTLLAIIFVAGQSYLFSAYEAHVINVTARICRYSETRTPGYWKNHEEVYAQYLPQVLGDVVIQNVEAANEVFINANAKDMSDMLRAQLLAMKFNIAHYDVGGYYVIGWGTIDEIVDLADDLLTPEYGTREEMEEVKDVLDYVNNLHRLTHCLDINPGFEPSFAIQGAPEPSEEIIETAVILSLEPEIAGALILNEPEVVTSEETTDSEGIMNNEIVPEEASVESSTEEQGVVGEIIEAVGNAVETVIETVVDVVENILGISDENVSNESVSNEQEEPIEPPIEIPPQPIEPPVTE